MEKPFSVVRPLLLICMSFFSLCKTLPKFVPVSEHQIEKLTVQNFERSYHVYSPKKAIDTPMPVVFVLHGGGGSSEGMIYLTRISELAERDGFVAVFPNGFENRWNDGRGILRFTADRLNINDVLFFREIHKILNQKFNIDSKRIHIVGLSNGGFMAQRALCEASDLFASGFSVAATTSKFLTKECNLTEPISIGFIFGKKDDIIPFNGGIIQIPSSPEPNSPKVSAGESESFLSSLDVWKNRLKCEIEEQEHIESLKKKLTKDITKFKYRSCKHNSIIDAYLIDSGGHFWPHGFYYLNDKKYGYLTEDLDASEKIIDFFKRTPKYTIGVN